MHTVGFFVLLALVVLGGAYLLSGYMQRVYEGQRTWLSVVFGPVERVIYRSLRIDAERDMSALAVHARRADVLGGGVPRAVR